MQQQKEFATREETEVPAEIALPIVAQYPAKDKKQMLWATGLACAAYVLFIVGILFLAPDPSRPIPFANKIIIVGIVFSLFALFFTAMCLEVQTYITATKEGLVWRRFWKKHFTAWSEIEDYYDDKLRKYDDRSLEAQISKGRYWFSAIELGGKERLSINKKWQNRAELMQAIERYATQARASSWQIKGTRACDVWPQRFTYNTKKSVLSLWLIVGSFIGIALLFFAVSWEKTLKDIAVVGWVLALLPLFIVNILLSPLFVGAFILLCKEIKQMKPRLNEVITATLEGVRWQKGEEISEARWEDITHFYARKGEFVLVLPGKEEHEIRFLSSLKNFSLLCAIIQRYVAFDKHKQTLSEIEEEIGTVPSQGTPIWGAQSFSYQTRMSRFVLRCLTGFALLILVILPLMRIIAIEPKPWSFGDFIPVFIFYIPIGLGWWWHLRASVEVDDLKITLRYPWGRREIPWVMVQSFGNTEDGLTLRLQLRNGKRLFVPLTARYNELVQTVQTHLPNVRE